MKAVKEKVGYLHIYEIVPTKKEVEFANIQRIKLVTMLSIYSDDKYYGETNKALSNNRLWSDEIEIKWFNYKYIETKPITGPLKKLRKGCHWEIEISQKQILVDDKKIQTYNCYTTLHYLKYLKKKHKVKAWIFRKYDIWSINPNEKYFELKDIHKYRSLIKKGKVVVFNECLANQCLEFRKKNGHTVTYIYDEYFIPKIETFDHKKRKKIRVGVIPKLLPDYDPERQRLVCITDGISVRRLKKYEADKIVKKTPTIKYCEKSLYYKYLKELRDGRVKVIDKPFTGRNRSDRRQILHKRKLYSRMHQSQLIEQWVPDATGKFETLESRKTIRHRMVPKEYTITKHNNISLRHDKLKKKTNKPSMFKKIEVDTKRIQISKFPYNQPMTVIYTEMDTDKVVHTIKRENVKMVNKHIVSEDPKTKEVTILCPVKNVEKWVRQEDYSHSDNTKTNWTNLVTIIPFKRTKIVPVEFHLVRKVKKIKHWHNPTKEPNWVGRKRRMAV